MYFGCFEVVIFRHLRSVGPDRRSCVGCPEWLPVACFGGHSPDAMASCSSRIPASSSFRRMSCAESRTKSIRHAARNQSGMPSIAVLRHRHRFDVFRCRAPSQAGAGKFCFPPLCLRTAPRVRELSLAILWSFHHLCNCPLGFGYHRNVAQSHPQRPSNHRR